MTKVWIWEAEGPRCGLQFGGKFAPLIGLRDEDMDINTMITTYNTAVTDAASTIYSLFYSIP